jgi:hypothetical protein
VLGLPHFVLPPGHLPFGLHLILYFVKLLVHLILLDLHLPATALLLPERSERPSGHPEQQKS